MLSTCTSPPARDFTTQPASWHRTLHHGCPRPQPHDHRTPDRGAGDAWLPTQTYLSLPLAPAHLSFSHLLPLSILKTPSSVSRPKQKNKKNSSLRFCYHSHGGRGNGVPHSRSGRRLRRAAKGYVYVSTTSPQHSVAAIAATWACPVSCLYFVPPKPPVSGEQPWCNEETTASCVVQP